MRILIANLKLFYQYRLLWCDYFFLAVHASVGWSFAHSGSGDNAHVGDVVSVGVMLLVMAVGTVVGFMRRHLAVCTVCLSLPSHRLTWRQLTFVVGLFVAFVGALVFLRYLSPERHAAMPSVQRGLAAFGVHFVVYLMGVFISVEFGRAPGGPMIFGAFLPFLGFWGRNHSDSFAAITGVVINSPGFVIILSTATAVVAWRSLGRQPYHRGSGRTTCHGSIHSVWATFFLARAHRSRYLAPAKYVWGTLYGMAMPGNPWRVCARSLALSGLVCVVLGTYLGTRAPLYMLVILFAIAILYNEHFPLYGNVLPTAGRNERFLATLAALVVLTFTTVLSVAVPIAISDLLAPFLPEFEVAGLKISYTPISLWLVMLPVVAVPVGSLCNMAFDCRSIERLFPIAFVFVVVFVAGHVVCSWMTPVPLSYVVLFTVLPWGLCTLGARCIAMENDLVSPQRRS
jgi:hypothetical protein